MEKKENKNKVEVKEVKEYKINIKYIDFIEKLIKEKIELNRDNKEYIEKLYYNIVNLRSSNIKRVDSRNKRVLLKDYLKSILDNKKIKEVDYLESSKKVVEILNKNKRGDYIRVKI